MITDLEERIAKIEDLRSKFQLGGLNNILNYNYFLRTNAPDIIKKLQEEILDIKSVNMALEAYSKDLQSVLKHTIENNGHMDKEGEDHARLLLGMPQNIDDIYTR